MPFPPNYYYLLVVRSTYRKALLVRRYIQIVHFRVCPIFFAIVYRYLQEKDCPHHKKTLLLFRSLLLPSCWAQHLDPKSRGKRAQSFWHYRLRGDKIPVFGRDYQYTCVLVVVVPRSAHRSFARSHAQENACIYAEENLVTALVPSETACLASSPGSMRRTAVWISREERVAFLL